MNRNKFIHIGLIAVLFAAVACEDNQSPTPKTTNTNPLTLSANFLLINASQDAPSLDMYVDNVKYGNSVSGTTGQSLYTPIPLTINAPTINGSAVASTNIRAKASSGSIGGVVGSSDLIFRAGNNNSNNFTAVSGGSYTLIVVDSLNRPKPLRTLNSSGFGDVTYYSSVSSFTAKKISDASADTVIQLSVGSSNSVDLANLLKKYNGGNLPSFLVPIGTVPLGSTDVGGVRFLLITDELPLPSSTRLPIPTAGKFAVRFVNASPDAGTVNCKINGVSVINGLNYSSTGTVGFSYPMTQANFNPSVGSRGGSATSPVTAGFKNDFAAAGSYDISVVAGAKTVTSNAQTFVSGGIYTVVLTGSFSKNTLAIALVQHK